MFLCMNILKESCSPCADLHWLVNILSPLAPSLGSLSGLMQCDPLKELLSNICSKTWNSKICWDVCLLLKLCTQIFAEMFVCQFAIQSAETVHANHFLIQPRIDNTHREGFQWQMHPKSWHCQRLLGTKRESRFLVNFSNPSDNNCIRKTNIWITLSLTSLAILSRSKKGPVYSGSANVNSPRVNKVRVTLTLLCRVDGHFWFTLLNLCRPIENYQLVDMSHLDKVIRFKQEVFRNSIRFCCFQK